MRLEHDFAGGDSVAWTNNVFRAATKFRLQRFLKGGGRDDMETESFGMAMAAAEDAMNSGYRVLVYAVTESGRSACLPQKHWGHFAGLWFERCAE